MVRVFGAQLVFAIAFKLNEPDGLPTALLDDFPNFNDDFPNFKIQDLELWTFENGEETKQVLFQKGYTPKDQVEDAFFQGYGFIGRKAQVKDIVRRSALTSGRIQFRQEGWDLDHVYRTILDTAKNSPYYAVDYDANQIELSTITYTYVPKVDRR